MSGFKILLVDDVKLIVELERNFLRFTPASVLTAASGEEALAIARDEGPQLIYLDLHMPKMDGADCCRRLKADPALRHIPVVMVANAGCPDDLTICRDAGCDACITKPLDRREFLSTGRQLLPHVDRREPRAPYEVPVSFQNGGVPGMGRSVDISAGGLFIALEKLISEQSIIAMNFPLPEIGTMPVMVKGRVTWSNDLQAGNRRKPHLPSGVGVEFIDLPETVRESIRSFVLNRQG